MWQHRKYWYKTEAKNGFGWGIFDMLDLEKYIKNHIENRGSHAWTQSLGVKSAGTHRWRNCFFFIFDRVFFWVHVCMYEGCPAILNSWQDGIVLGACNNKQLTQRSKISPTSSSVSLSIHSLLLILWRLFSDRVHVFMLDIFICVCCMYRCVETRVYLCNSWAYGASLRVEAHLFCPTKAVFVCYVKKHRAILGCGGLKFKLTNGTGSHCCYW